MIEHFENNCRRISAGNVLLCQFIEPVPRIDWPVQVLPPAPTDLTDRVRDIRIYDVDKIN